MKIFDPRVGRMAGYRFSLSSLLEVTPSTKELRMPCGSKKPTTKKPPKK